MSQHGSMVASENSEAKYKKALKEISKLIGANKLLRDQSDQMRQVLQAQNSDLTMRYEQLQKQFQIIKEQKQSLQKYLEEVNDTNTELRKQYHNMQREVGYLNDVLTEQNTQLKKVSAFKDEKGISNLFRSYQQRQNSLKKDVTRLEEYVSSLKETVDTLQNEINQERSMRQRYQDQYNIVGLQINKYKQLNNYLMNQNENIINSAGSEGGFNRSKQVQKFVYQFKSQLQMIRQIKTQAQNPIQKQYAKNYELLIEQKNTITIQYAKLKDQFQMTENKLREMYEMEEKMSTALARAAILSEQVNMLKNKITVMESKELMDEGLDQQYDLNEFQEKINVMMSQTDPLVAIKNGDDNSHFMIMKSYVRDLQQRLAKVNHQRLNFQRKYKNLKIKFNKKAQQYLIFSQSNKLLKGKVQGFQRLTQKLHYQLQRSIEAHQQEIVKMTAITNNLVSQKVQQSKASNAFIKSQLDLQIERFEKSEKTLQQELDSLKIQIGTYKIKIFDYEQRLRQTNQLLEIYQAKSNELADKFQQLEQHNSELNESLIKYQQLYNEEKIKHEALLIQKQNLASRANYLSDVNSQINYKFQEELRQKEQQLNAEIRKYKAESFRYKEQLETTKSELQITKREIQERRARDSTEISSLKNQSRYYLELEQNYARELQKNGFLESQLERINSKIHKVHESGQKMIGLESELMKRNDEINDLKRKILNLQKDLQMREINKTQLIAQKQQLVKQVGQMRSRIQDSSQGVKKQLDTRELQYRKTIQRLNQEVALLQSEIRDQKRNNSRYISQIQLNKDQQARLFDSIQRMKQRQISMNQHISELSTQIDRLQDELNLMKTKYSYNETSLNNKHDQIVSSNERNTKLNQQISEMRFKVQNAQSRTANILRDVSSMKFYFNDVQKMISRLNSQERLEWDQQRERDNLLKLVQAFKKLSNSGSDQGASNQYSYEYRHVPATSFASQLNVTRSYDTGKFDSGANLATNYDFDTKYSFGGQSAYKLGTQNQYSSNEFRSATVGITGTENTYKYQF